MRHLSLLLIVLMLALTGCPRIPGLRPLPELMLSGQVLWQESYRVQAVPAEVANGATVSLIDPATGMTLVTALTQPNGEFSLNIRTAALESDRPYLLEALKGLSAGGQPNRAGAPAARLRTLVSQSGGAWTSLTGPSIQIGPNSTAVCVVSGFRGLTLSQQQALMGRLSPTTGVYTATPELPGADFTTVAALVNASVTLDQDPLQVIARNSLNGTYVRMERGPFVTNLSALRATPGNTITLYGTGFDPVASNNLIVFNGTSAASASFVPGGISVTVPAGATSGPLTLRVGNLETVVAAAFATALPMTTIETIAGTTTPPLGAQATGWGTAPNAVAVDTAGSFFFVDSMTHRVYKVSPDGTLSPYAGRGGTGSDGDGGQATSAGLNYPTALAVDAAGNLFIADTNNYRVRRVDAVTGVISTVAGNGLQGTTGDGTAATLARLDVPQSVALDGSGNLFILDRKLIRKVDTSGVITRYAGGGAGTGDGIQALSANLEDPRGIAADTAGNLYFAQIFSANRVRKIATDGLISTLATEQAWSVAADGIGNVYYYGAYNYTIRKIPPVGPIVSVAGISGQQGFTGDGGPATSARISASSGGCLAVTSDGTLYLAGNYRVRRVAAGTISTVAGSGGLFSGDGGQAIDAQFNNSSSAVSDAEGNLYVADTANYRVRRISATGVITTYAGNGTVGSAGNGGPATSAQLIAPKDIAVDATGTLYILDASVVRRVGTDGIITHYAGSGATLGDGGQAAVAQLNTPEGIAVDAAGNLHIADYNNHRVRKVDRATGVITTFAGGGAVLGDNGPATSAQTFYPSDIAFDGAGNMYLSCYHYRIRKVTPAGIITTIGGNGSSVNSGDGGLALNARIDYTKGIAVDPGGNVYFTTGDRVRRITPEGYIHTVVGGAVWGFGGDGGLATSALLYNPSKLSIDSQGRMLIGDSSNKRIRRLY